MKRLILYLIMIVFGARAAYRAFALDAVAEPHTEAAVSAADEGWLAAELRGDFSALDARLMPNYRDVSAEGRVHAKQDLLRAWRNTSAELPPALCKRLRIFAHN